MQPPFSSPSARLPHVPASLAYKPSPEAPTNPEPFVLSPIVNLPPSFGSAYVGETFSCTLCANHDPPPTADGASPPVPKTIRDVRIEAEMKTPSAAAPVKLDLVPHGPDPDAGTDLAPAAAAAGSSSSSSSSSSSTLQRILAFDLREEGSHVLAVTVSYYEASPLSGRTRTFRKLYQFVCKPSLVVRTKPGVLPPAISTSTSTSSVVGGAESGPGDGARKKIKKKKRWVLEAQLENCSDEGMLLERVGLELEGGLRCEDCNAGLYDDGDVDDHDDGRGQAYYERREGREGEGRRPVLQPGETEQVCFVLEEEEEGSAVEQPDGRVVFGVLQIGWRSEMGNRGFLSTGKLGTRFGKGTPRIGA